MDILTIFRRHMWILRSMKKNVFFEGFIPFLDYQAKNALSCRTVIKPHIHWNFKIHRNMKHDSPAKTLILTKCFLLLVGVNRSVEPIFFKCKNQLSKCTLLLSILSSIYCTDDWAINICRSLDESQSIQFKKKNVRKIIGPNAELPNDQM